MKEKVTNQVIRMRELRVLTTLSTSSLYEKQNRKSQRFDPTFPSKIKLGERAVGWLKAEVEAWLNAAKEKSISGGEHS